MDDSSDNLQAGKKCLSNELYTIYQRFRNKNRNIFQTEKYIGRNLLKIKKVPGENSRDLYTFFYLKPIVT
jgi:hypothetical protein